MVAIFENNMTLDEFVLRYREVDIDKVGISTDKLKSLSVSDTLALNLFLAGKGFDMKPRKIVIDLSVLPVVSHNFNHYSHN